MNTWHRARSGSSQGTPQFGVGFRPVSSQVRQFAYLDVTNIFVAGAQVSASIHGLAASPSGAADQKISDPNYRLNFRSLHEFVVGSASNTARTVCVGSVKVEGDARIANAAQFGGWQANMQVRSRSGREKAVDTSLTVMMLEDLLSTSVDPREVEVTLLSGDRDFVPAVQAARRRGFSVDVIAWEHSIATELKQAASCFIPLNDYFDLVAFRKNVH